MNRLLFKPEILLATLFMLLFSIGGVQAQFVEYSQFQMSPSSLNPSLTGIAHGPRIALLYRNQWPQLNGGANGGFTSYHVDYAQHVESLSGGIGLSVDQHQVGDGLYKRSAFAASYAYQARNRTNTFAVRIGLSALYQFQGYDVNNLRFLDQIDPVYGFTNISGIPNTSADAGQLQPNLHEFNMNAGLSIVSPRGYLGLSFYNFLPSPALFENSIKNGGFRVHGSYSFPLDVRRKSSNFISPFALFSHQGELNRITLGTEVTIYPMFFSLGFRHTIGGSDAVYTGLGFALQQFKLMYSHDIHFAQASAMQASHEVSLIFNLSKEANSVRPSYIEGKLLCPSHFLY
ncbi:MAG: PorP/SprF family type IX secretion system membrane protein [Bacteroidota bacterium]|nr:PorP/SprF family type IX secretion system membrane protein [Bacteroidota bacterium]